MPESTPAACPVPPAGVAPTATRRAFQCRLELPNDPRTPRVVRQAIRAALLGQSCPQGLTDTAELLAPELLSNAVKHSDGLITVTLRADPDHIHIASWTTTPNSPAPSPPPRTRNSVAACSSSKPWRTSGAVIPSPGTSESAAGRWCGSNCRLPAIDRTHLESCGGCANGSTRHSRMFLQPLWHDLRLLLWARLSASSSRARMPGPTPSRNPLY